MGGYKETPYYVRAKALVACALLSAKRAGAATLVNGGQSPFILTVDECRWLCYLTVQQPT